LVIRIDHLGRAEALSYANFEYKPQDAEAKYFLSQFCALYYRRNRYTMNDDFSKSLYFLDGKLASDIIDAYKKNGVIKSFLTDPSQPEIDIEVKNVALEGMQTSPLQGPRGFRHGVLLGSRPQRTEAHALHGQFRLRFQDQRPERTHSHQSARPGHHVFPRRRSLQV
jgi:hypothetical protein